MLALILALTFGSLDLSVLNVPVVPEQPKIWTREEETALPIEKAEEYGLHKKRFLATLECENGFNAKGQSEHYYKGVREDSWGSAQINLPSHKSITKKMAEDPEFAVTFMAAEWSKRNHLIWSCYEILFPSS